MCFEAVGIDSYDFSSFCRTSRMQYNVVLNHIFNLIGCVFMG